MRRIGVLISGRGSNMQALVDAAADGRVDAEIVVVISNNPDATGLERARRAGIEAIAMNHRGSPSRDDFDRELARQLQSRNVELVCLAGFMRLIGRPMLDAFPDAILNIHPSLLPSFPGVDAQRQALAHGVKVTGATVHLVTGELDGGPIILQSAVPVLDGDTEATLSTRILAEEHRIYPAAVNMMLAGGWRVEGRRFVPSDGRLPL
jgi:phosphoribosylglycinamide formyltransferase-1